MGSTVRASRSTARSNPLNRMFRRPHALRLHWLLAWGLPLFYPTESFPLSSERGSDSQEFIKCLLPLFGCTLEPVSSSRSPYHSSGLPSGGSEGGLEKHGAHPHADCNAPPSAFSIPGALTPPGSVFFLGGTAVIWYVFASFLK